MAEPGEEKVAMEEEKKDDGYQTVNKLSECAVFLEGETVLPTPRVSREALITVLKEHNQILGMLRVDLGTMSSFLQKVALDANETRVTVNGIKDEMKIHRADLNSVTERTNAMEHVTSSLQKRLEEVDDLANSVEAQGKHLKSLQGEFDNEVDLSVEFRQNTEKRIEEEAARTVSLEATRETMQDRIDHMHEEIQITAEQIIFTREPLEGEVVEDPTDLDLNLSHVLVELREKAIGHSNILEIQRKVLRNHGDELERKAKIEVEDFVRKHDEHLTRIQKKMDADADVDLSDIRRNQESITTTLEAVQAGMLEKTDKMEVDAKIEHKYEEILDHLQTALHATEEDEDDFKSATEALNKAIDDLRSTKVDRKEFGMLRQKIKELEEKIRKGGGGGGGSGGGGGLSIDILEDYPTREELADVLEEKVGIEEYDHTRVDLDRRITALEANAANSMYQGGDVVTQVMNQADNENQDENAMSEGKLLTEISVDVTPAKKDSVVNTNQLSVNTNHVDDDFESEERLTQVPEKPSDDAGPNHPLRARSPSLSVANMNTSFNMNSSSSNNSNSGQGQAQSGGGKMPTPHTGPHSPGSFRPQPTSPAPHLKPQPIHGSEVTRGGSGQGKRTGKSGGSGGMPALEGTSLTVTVNETGDNFRPGSSSSNRGRPSSSQTGGLGNTVGVLSQQVNQLAVSVARIEMRLNGGFGAYGAPREFSNSNRIGSAPVPGNQQNNGVGMGGVGVAGGMGGINAAYCLSCDNPVGGNPNKTGLVAASMYQQQGNQMTNQGGFHFPPNQGQGNGNTQQFQDNMQEGGTQAATQVGTQGYLQLPSVPDASSTGSEGVAMTGFAINQEKGSLRAQKNMPPQAQANNRNTVPGQGGQERQGGLPMIDRGTYYPPAREVTTEMMGVKGADGRLYRSDVPKSGDGQKNSGARKSKSKQSKATRGETMEDTPQLEN